MAGAPASFVKALRRLDQPFDIDDVRSQHPHLSRETIRVYLSLATRDGLLERVGMGTYQRPVRPSVEAVSAYEPLEKLRANLMPDVWHQLVVWSDEDVAGFTHDAIMSTFLVIEAPRKASETVQTILERNGTWVVPSNNRRGLAAKLRQSRLPLQAGSEGPVILVPNEEMTGTRISVHGYRVPQPERLFLDFFGDDPGAFDFLVDASDHSSIDPLTLLRLASSRKRSVEIASMLATIVAIYPDHPIREILMQRWPWIARIQ